MNDALGQAVLRSVALACGLLWLLDLVCPVLAQTLNGLGESSRDDGPADR